MGIASLSPKSGRNAPCHARTRGAQVSILSSVLALGMAFDTKIVRADRACEIQAENSVDLTVLRLDNVETENRLIHPRCGSSNTER